VACAIDDRQHRVAFVGARLRRAAERALTAVGRRGGAVEVAVVDDRDIRRLNRAWRGVSRPTDVLALPLESVGAAGGLVGQIVLSAETAARQAGRLGVSVATELDLLVTHGVLHLVGWDDRDPVEARLMHERARQILTAGGRRVPARLWRGLLT
jgi:probable rRNA maturation factor